jgi:hypothetical protein
MRAKGKIWGSFEMPSKFFTPDADLQATLAQILEETWAAFPQLAQNQIAVTWIVYDPPYRVNTGGGLSAAEFWQYQPAGASYRGVELIDPAGAVALFYLVAVQVWLEQGMVPPAQEISRAIADMMASVGNCDAISYLLDVLSGTSSGPALPPGPYVTWQAQRNIVNRYFQQLGWPELRAVNVNQKLWSNGPYGRESSFLGEANRNLLTTEATARLLHSIVGGVSVSAARSQGMMALMRRSLNSVQTTAPHTDQVTGFIGAGLPSDTTLWSKAGAARGVRHDIAYVESSQAHPYALVVFTEGEYNQAIIPWISQRIFEACQQRFKAIP